MRGTEAAKARILAALPPGWFMPMDAMHPEKRRQAVDELQAEGRLLRIPGSRDVVMSLDMRRGADEDALPGIAVAMLLSSGVNTALRRLAADEPPQGTDVQQMVRAGLAERTPSGTVVTEAGRDRLRLLALADDRIARISGGPTPASMPVTAAQPTTPVAAPEPPRPDRRPVEETAPHAKSAATGPMVGTPTRASAPRPRPARRPAPACDLRTKRAFRLAALAARADGGDANEHLGEAWLISEHLRTVRIMVDTVLERDAAGLIPGDAPPTGLDPDAIDAEADLATAVMEGAYEWDARRKIGRTLLTLTPREQRVLAMRFNLWEGATGIEPTLTEVGNELGVSPERVRQMEAKALRKLKHPSRSRTLRSLMSEGAPHLVERMPVSADGELRGALGAKPWRRRVQDAGGDPGTALWPWHGCPIVRAAIEAGVLRHPYAIMNQRVGVDQNGRARERPPEPIADMTATWMMTAGVALASTITFASGAKYELRNWRRQHRHIVVEARLQLPPMPDTIVVTLAGKPLRHVVDHWAMDRFEIVEATVTPDATVLRITGRTAALGRGSGRYEHPLGLSAC